MNKLYMLIGLPASGKSTIAKELSKSEGAIIVSSDEIRKELLGDINDQTQNAKVFEEVEKRIKEGLLKCNVIYDATNINYKKRRAFLQKLNKMEVEKIAVLVATPYKECLKRNAKRERKVPEEVIKNMYFNFYIPQYYEGFDDIQIKYNSDYMFYWDELQDISQDNPHHTLSILKHCEKTMEILKELKPELKNVGLLHDIGKLKTKSFDNKHNDTEEWKDIEEFQKRYQVSSFGNIRSKKTMKNLKARKHSGGYLQVNIRNNGKLKNYYIHRIVAQYFCDNNLNEDIVNLDVNHRDGNKRNNFYKNLEWCTRSENVRHCFYTNKKRNRFGTDVPSHKLSYEDIKKIKRIKKEEKLSNKKISEIFKISESQITRVLNGKTYTNKIIDKVVQVEPIVPQKYASFYNHEKVSAYDSLFLYWIKFLVSLGGEEDVLNKLNLIQWHMLLHFNLSEKTIAKYKNMLGEDTWRDLEILYKADCEAR